MPTKLPRVIGLADLLGLEKPLRERPAPVVYFSDAEFKRLTKGAAELKRRPSPGVSLPAFDPWPGGGMVQSRCDSPEGQLCYGLWRPGPGGGGVYFECVCRPTPGRSPLPTSDCSLQIDKQTRVLTCVGTCRFGSCSLGLYREGSTGRVVLGCRCAR
jgi:hypothetical protein